jgi:LmbE family N-acetylglucosaminyl deacetylase
MNTLTVSSLGTILGIWAHPDDDTFFAAGLYAAARANNQNVVNIFATKGEKGLPKNQSKMATSMAEIRQKEATSALKLLGVNKIIWLGYTDGECANAHTQAAIDKLVSQIEKIKPDTVLSFAADGVTGHNDHKTVSSWVTQATAKASHKARLLQTATTRSWADQFADDWRKINAYYLSSLPNTTPFTDLAINFELNDELISLKLEALQCHASQTGQLFRLFSRERLASMFKNESFCEAK